MSDIGIRFVSGLITLGVLIGAGLVVVIAGLWWLISHIHIEWIAR